MTGTFITNRRAPDYGISPYETCVRCDNQLSDHYRIRECTGCKEWEPECRCERHTACNAWHPEGECHKEDA